MAKEMTLAEKVKQRREDPRAFALGAIERLNAQRKGNASFDAWIDQAVNQWRAFLAR